MKQVATVAKNAIFPFPERRKTTSQINILGPPSPMATSFMPGNRSGSQLTTLTNTAATTTIHVKANTTTPTNQHTLQIHSDAISCVVNNRTSEILNAADAPLPLTKVILPAQVVVAHQLDDQQHQQQQQQSVLLQALTSNSTSHLIALVSSSEEEGLQLHSGQAVPCVQYVDERGASNIYTAPNGHMTAYSTYTTTPEQANMFTPHSAAYYNNTSNTENYNSVNNVNDGSGIDSDAMESGSYTEQGDVFNGIDENSLMDPDCKSLYSSSRLSAATLKWLMDNYEMAEGLSVPRGAMYNHYLRHCEESKMEPLNAASFGKLIRSVFSGLRTRRLGTRGNSKYHYYGIRLRACANIDNIENVMSSSVNYNPFARMRKSRPENQMKLDRSEEGNFNSRERENNRCDSAPSEKHMMYLGDASAALPSVEIEINSCSLPDGVTMEDVREFQVLYIKHCETFLDSVINFQFAVIESLWNRFWRKSDDPELESIISKSVLFSLCLWKPIQEFVKQMDYQFYQNLVDVLVPDVLRPIPSTLTQAIRTFAKNLEGWLKIAMSDCHSDIRNIKVSAISAFAQTLRRYTSLNHLAQAARAVLQSNAQIKQMTSDLNRVDFRSVQEQASWVCQCDDKTVNRILVEFRDSLTHQLWLEAWGAWLENIVMDTLKPFEGKPNYPKAARHFLLKWSFYSSLVIRDLTLRSAASFGSFHLLRLLYDEYMFYIIEHAIAKATGTMSIAVMGEYLCCGEPEKLYSDTDWTNHKRQTSFSSTESQEEQCIVNGDLDADEDPSQKKKRID